MKIGFYLLWEKKPLFYVFADAMIRSVRQHMPDVEIVQMTDMNSPPASGVDSVRRIPKTPLPLMRATHFASVEGDWLFVDTDVIFQRSVAEVFNQDFEIGVANRREEQENDFTREMPYNAGVIFSRSARFWKDEQQLVSGPNVDAWYGDQKAICTLISTGAYKTVLLPVDYNYAPSGPDDDLSQRAIVHYKGTNRKEWLFDRIRREMGLCA